MSNADRALPARPSREHLRKQAKRLAKADVLGLAAAQRQLARTYGASSWAELMRRIEPAPPRSPLAAAARDGDLDTVRRLVAEGQAIDDPGGPGGTPLWEACASRAPEAARIAIAEALLAAGANPRRDNGGETALHAAARRGPLALVELLIRNEALEWQADSKGKQPLHAAKKGKAKDKAAIIAVLDRSIIRDPAFRAAVKAIHTGDAAGLARLLDAEPRLLHARNVGPACYRAAKRFQYFMDPKLFWFIANNPTLIKRMPANMVAVAQVMIDRGVDQADLDYALELVMTSLPAREQGLQLPLIALLMKAGAVATTRAIEVTLAHWELEPIKALLAGGHKLTASMAAGLGQTGALTDLLRTAAPEEVQRAFGIAVINRQNEAARLALDAGADVNGFLPVHSHSLPLHQAAIDENMELMALLIARGARTDIPDRLWGSTPLGWAMHQGKERVVAYLRQLVPSAGTPG
jgi:hypothetical protein